MTRFWYLTLSCQTIKYFQPASLDLLLIWNQMHLPPPLSACGSLTLMWSVSQFVPAPVGPACPPSSLCLWFSLWVASSHKDGAIRAQLSAGWIYQPGLRLPTEHWVRCTPPHCYMLMYPEWCMLDYLHVKLPASRHSGKIGMLLLLLIINFHC